MKNNWKEEYLEQLVDKLNIQIVELEKDVENLQNENTYLKKQIASKVVTTNETVDSIKKSLRKLESQYRADVDELKILKERYRNAINDAKNMKNEYTLKFKDVIKSVNAGIKK